jgi:hypothetical protein
MIELIKDIVRCARSSWARAIINSMVLANGCFALLEDYNVVRYGAGGCSDSTSFVFASTLNPDGFADTLPPAIGTVVYEQPIGTFYNSTGSSIALFRAV